MVEVYYIVFNYFWQLIMVDKTAKRCVKRIHLVTDGDLCDWKTFYKVKIVFYSSSNINIATAEQSQERYCGTIVVVQLWNNPNCTK